MKVTISFTPEERDQAWKVREVLLQLLAAALDALEVPEITQ